MEPGWVQQSPSQVLEVTRQAVGDNFDYNAPGLRGHR